MVFVVHGHPERLAGRGQGFTVERLADPTGTVDRSVLGRVGQDCETTSAEASMTVVALMLSSAMPLPSSGTRSDPVGRKAQEGAVAGDGLFDGCGFATAQ
jgi:hypothetical protein